ncbi:MAG: ABC transporter ATP-binding protein [Pseudomonadota bacterium]
MLSLESIHHKFGSAEILKGIDLTVQAGEIVCLLGASGSGKSTLLRIVAGLEPLQKGEIKLEGKPFARPGREPAPERRRFGMVFQDHVLFPHMNIAQNIAFGLDHLDKSAAAVRIGEQLANVGLADFDDRFPHTLSGGQQQRVALARALAPEPRLMLLDEPFASIDSTLRRQLREDTRRALRAANVPAIVVTHDAQEAMEMADRIAVIGSGEVVQVDTPQALWEKPVSRFVAELFSETDAISGSVEDGVVRTAFGAIKDVNFADRAEGSKGLCHVIVRSGSVSLRNEPEQAHEHQVMVEDVRFLGDHYVVMLCALDARMRVTSAALPGVAIGDRVSLDFDSNGVLVYFP